MYHTEIQHQKSKVKNEKKRRNIRIIEAKCTIGRSVRDAETGALVGKRSRGLSDTSGDRETGKVTIHVGANVAEAEAKKGGAIST